MNRKRGSESVTHVQRHGRKLKITLTVSEPGGSDVQTKDDYITGNGGEGKGEKDERETCLIIELSKDILPKSRSYKPKPEDGEGGEY